MERGIYARSATSPSAANRFCALTLPNILVVRNLEESALLLRFLWGKRCAVRLETISELKVENGVGPGCRGTTFDNIFEGVVKLVVASVRGKLQEGASHRSLALSSDKERGSDKERELPCEQLGRFWAWCMNPENHYPPMEICFQIAETVGRGDIHRLCGGVEKTGTVR